jgi:hypothetical protein
MQRPWVTPLVVGFWCITTGWLVVEKIVPSLLPGSPPGYQALYSSGNKTLPVGWTVFWNGQPMGSAVSRARQTEEGGMVVDSLLRFDRLPIDEMLPSWTKMLVRRALEQHETGKRNPLESMTLTSRGRLTIDPQGQLVSFHSAVDLPGTEDPLLLDGTVDEGHVKIVIKSGDLRYETSRYLPSHIMIGDELSPQATLPGLHKGRHWTVPVYSPLRPGHAPIEVLYAEVTGEETIFWEDRPTRVNVVTYRNDPSSHRDPRCRLWVDGSGRVLRQETAMLGSTMTFLRHSDEVAEKMVEQGDLTADALEVSPTAVPVGNAAQ